MKVIRFFSMDRHKSRIGRRVFLRDNDMIEPRHRRYGNRKTIAALLPEPILQLLYCLKGRPASAYAPLRLVTEDNDSSWRRLRRDAPCGGGIVNQQEIPARRAGETLSVECENFCVAGNI